MPRQRASQLSATACHSHKVSQALCGNIGSAAGAIRDTDPGLCQGVAQSRFRMLTAMPQGVSWLHSYFPWFSIHSWTHQLILVSGFQFLSKTFDIVGIIASLIDLDRSERTGR